MKQRHKFSLGYSLVVFFTIIMLESLFFTGTAVREIPYSRFRELLKADRIQSVIVKSSRIYGLQKAPQSAGESNAAGHASEKSLAFQPQRKQAPGI